MALLFLIYPGYLSQVNAIDYQSYTVSLCCAMFSLALTFQSVLIQNKVLQLIFGVASVLLGWWYLALVEYFLGLEALRFLGLFLLATRMQNFAWPSVAKRFIRQSLAFLSIPAVFLFWRVFVFQNERRATDVAAQLGRVIISPTSTGAAWFVSLWRDLINVVVLGWFVPLYNTAFQARLRYLSLGIVVALLAVLLMILLFGRNIEKDGLIERDNWRKEAFWGGLLAAVAGLLPIILANRHVDFTEFSRYTLPGAAGGMIALVSLIYTCPEKTLRIGVISSLVFSGTLVHYVNAASAAHETEAVNEFWWQVSWRAPQIAKRTTLIVKYAEVGIPEDYVIWGPANLIYYRDRHSERPVNTDLYAAVLNNDTISNVLARFGNKSELGRGTVSFRDYKKILIITQSSPTSCVHIIDGRFPEFSLADDPGIMLIGPHSNIGNVLLDETFHAPPTVIFGLEPEHHQWCFYYQKASLARQQENWNAIAQLQKEVTRLNLHPDDQIEWMPFLQAAAMLGDEKQIKQISTRMNTERFYKYQACQNLKGAIGLTSYIKSYVIELFCNE
jgi:hypothetical protein